MQSDTQILSGCGLKRLSGTMRMARKFESFPIPVSVTEYTYSTCMYIYCVHKIKGLETQLCHGYHRMYVYMSWLLCVSFQCVLNSL